MSIDRMIEDIDALIDETMANGVDAYGEPLDDYRANRYPTCGHCQRAWHGLPLTQKVATMYAWGDYDPAYRVDEDDSPVVCLGSEFIGPQPAPPESSGGPWSISSEGFQLGSWRPMAVTVSQSFVVDYSQWMDEMSHALRGISTAVSYSITTGYSSFEVLFTPPTPRACDESVLAGVRLWDHFALPLIHRLDDYVVVGPILLLTECWAEFRPTLVLPKGPGYDFTDLITKFQDEYPTSGEFMRNSRGR